LLPLAEEETRLAHATAPLDPAGHDCGCHDRRRTPCPGCLRRDQ
jgi:hypothetical protein